MAKTFDTERRSELAVAMQQTILDDYGFVFCSHLKMSMISKSTVTGLTAHPCDFYEITVDLAPAIIRQDSGWREDKFMEEIWHIKSVEVCFAGQAVVHDVSFSLHAGEILGIVGESGSGKSTILKACMGLLGNSGMVTRGDIEF